MISSTVNRTVYNGDGTSATFAFPYEFFAQGDLKVYLYNSSTQTAALQVLNTNYTVGGTANAQGVYTQGGSVITTCAVPSSLMVVMYRDGSPVQNFQLIQNGQINSVALTQQLDYLTLLCQRLQDQCSRSVRLADSFAPTFDPTLPLNAGAAPAKFLVVNSTATGFIFSNTNGASYIPNTLVYSPDAVSIASLGGSPAGFVLQSNGSSAPTWAAISLSGSSVAGTLNLSNGGTGGLLPQQWGVVFCSSATQLATTDPAPVGFALISNASSSPKFQAMNFATAGSGILPTANGGAGTGGNDVPFIGNGAGVASTYRALNLASGSSVTGILAAGNGGTGLGSAFTQYALIYAASASALGMVASVAAGQMLISQGSSAPIFQPFSFGSSALLVVNNLSDLANKATAFNNIMPGTTFGDVMYVGSGVVGTRLAAGTSGFFLQTQGAGAAPVWAAALANPMTTRGDVIFAGSAAVTSRLAAGAAGTVLTSQGNQADPTWTSPLVNPMTTLGDIITGGAAGAATRLAGSISNSSAILVQTGSGGASAAPSWKVTSAPTVNIISVLGIGTYTPPTGIIGLKVTAIGGGGAGGGSASTSVQSGAGAGGGSGGVAIKWFYGSSIVSSYSFTVGAGGSAGAAGNTAGNNGSSSVFAFMTAGGGNGGGGSATSATANVGGSTGGGGAPTNGDLNYNGGSGANGIILAAAVAVAGAGGQTPGLYSGCGAQARTSQGTGIAGGTGGGGGSGGVSLSNGGTVAGGVGGAGLIIVEEYYY